MKTLFFKTDKQNQTTFECLFESKQTAKNNKSLKTYMKSLFFKTGKQKHQVYSCNLDSKMIPYKPRINIMAYQCINQTKKN